ncbi:hypothetical protein EMIHUDRAFT_201144 [Emiliania huxleyi CCMP1516]|uniref:RRM domain-containing protein n=2 Tax=Emiliania huxleyi TaxID=2903 RepID=A0A0D3KM81_EMIH1|nr:hypothetical protein EMIHUDRAFT_201144 [Emiliania huxleyi CCMP1516]EOD36866.1 hypothetical protein EMIHUDRAFT_201144 [Emiliania huxleyi CCMP1516]|eukprot:XP_005789295.1 hypothetical protein EMIHUDRAFT_201144 [Emiliania huxleyi CCMP1516]
MQEQLLKSRLMRLAVLCLCLVAICPAAAVATRGEAYRLQRLQRQRARRSAPPPPVAVPAQAGAACPRPAVRSTSYFYVQPDNSRLGLSVVCVRSGARGLVFLDEAGYLREPAQPGDVRRGTVLRAREDGRLDVSFREYGARAKLVSAESTILDALLAAPDHSLPLGDKSPPTEAKGASWPADLPRPAPDPPTLLLDVPAAMAEPQGASRLLALLEPVAPPLSITGTRRPSGAPSRLARLEFESADAADAAAAAVREEGGACGPRVVFVGNLPPGAGEEELWDTFLDCGRIQSVSVAEGASGGFGHALRLRGSLLHGRRLVGLCDGGPAAR